MLATDWRIGPMGNIVNGVELIKRHSSKEVFGLTTPLITLASGAKMEKLKAVQYG